MSARGWLWPALALLAAPFLGRAGLAAQQVGGEVAYHSVSIGDLSVSEMAVPIGVMFRLGALRLDANTAVAAAHLKGPGIDSRLSGLTDITARLMIPMLEDRARLVLAANVPTGTASLNAAELPVAAALTTDILTLPVSSFGSGGGVTTGFAASRPWGSWVVGGMAAFRVGAAYEPLVSTAAGPSAEFRPGEELRLRLAAEHSTAGGLTLRFAGSWSTYAEDQVDGASFFNRGDRFLGEATAEFPLGRGAGVVYGWDLHSSRGSTAPSVQQPLQAAAALNLLGAGVRVQFPVNANLTLRPVLELLSQSADAAIGPGSGTMFRLGGGVARRMGRLILEPALLFQVGSLDGERITGLVVRGGVAWAR